MGLFHFEMAILGQIFKNFYGDRMDRWSLTRCMDELGRDPARMWNKTKQHVQNFNICKDFFDIVLDGALVAMISFYYAPSAMTIANLEHHLRFADAQGLEAMSESLAAFVMDFDRTSKLSEAEPRSNSNMSSKPPHRHERTFQNLMLFIQHGMMFRTLDRAIREGDSGRILMCISYFVVWFQGTKNHNYANETMRLTACIKRLWSDPLKQFWKQNCVVNLSGKNAGFVALDSLNEYLVGEVKSMMGQSVTPEMNERLRNVLSLLVFDFKDIKQTMANESHAEIFDFHSTPPTPWHDIRRIARLIVEGRVLVLPTGNTDSAEDMLADGDESLEIPQSDSYAATDLFVKGITELAGTKSIMKLKDALANGDIMYDLDDDEAIESSEDE